MKKIFLSFVAILCLHSMTLSQDYSDPIRVFQKHQTDLQFSIGILPSDVLLDKASPEVIPLNIELNHMVGDRFSLGFNYGISVMKSKAKTMEGKQEQQVKKEWHQIGIKPAFHITRFRNADYYGGFALILNKYNMTVLKGDENFMKKHLGFRPNFISMGYSGVVGARFAIKSKWTAFAEFNFGSASLFNAGVGYKL